MQNNTFKSGCDSLECSATNCTYNENYLCKAGAIKVGGREAVTTDQTYCDSFIDAKNGEFTNNVGNECTKTETIKCEAYKCRYNENEHCTAENVKINKNDTSCQTFIKE